MTMTTPITMIMTMTIAMTKQYFRLYIASFKHEELGEFEIVRQTGDPVEGLDNFSEFFQLLEV